MQMVPKFSVNEIERNSLDERQNGAATWNSVLANTSLEKLDRPTEQPNISSWAVNPPPPGRVGGEVALVEVGWRGAPAETPPRGEGPGAGPILGGEERDGVSEDGASASGSNRLDSVAGGRRFRGSLCRRPPLCVAPPFRYEVTDGAVWRSARVGLDGLGLGNGPCIPRGSNSWHSIWALVG
jgi:hypothetical protein